MFKKKSKKIVFYFISHPFIIIEIHRMNRPINETFYLVFSIHKLDVDS